MQKVFSLRPGRQEVAFEPEERVFHDARAGVELTGVSYVIGANLLSSGGAWIETVKIPSLSTRFYPLSRLETRAAYVIPGSVKARLQIPRPYPWSPPFSIEAEAFFRGPAKCNISGSLRSKGFVSMGGTVVGTIDVQAGFHSITLHPEDMKIDKLLGGPYEVTDVSLTCLLSKDDGAKVNSFAVPSIDFRGLPGARCLHDENNDGRVDEEDVKLAGIPMENDFRKFGSLIPEDRRERMRASLREEVLRNRSCRTR